MSKITVTVTYEAETELNDVGELELIAQCIADFGKQHSKVKVKIAACEARADVLLFTRNDS